MRIEVDIVRSEADAKRITEIFSQREGAAPEGWEFPDGAMTYVARSHRDGRVVAFAMVRFGMPTVVDALEAERENGHATIAGVYGMRALGEWIEAYVSRCGGGRIVAFVVASNEDHQAALKQKGYSDRMHCLAKDIQAVRSGG